MHKVDFDVGSRNSPGFRFFSRRVDHSASATFIKTPKAVGCGSFGVTQAPSPLHRGRQFFD